MRPSARMPDTFEAREQGIADRNGSLFVVLRLEPVFGFEAHRDGLVLPVNVHPLRDRSFTDSKTGPDEKSDSVSSIAVRDLEEGGDLVSLYVAYFLFLFRLSTLMGQSFFCTHSSLGTYLPMPWSLRKPSP